MLTPKQLQNFFDSNNILLESCIFIGKDKTEEVLKTASNNFGLSFFKFVEMLVINNDRDSFETNFDSWDHLYESYAAFVIGYQGNSLLS